MQLHTKCLVHDQAISIWSTCLYPTLMLLGSIHIWRQIFFGFFWPNQILCYISLCSKIRCSFTYLSTYLNIWCHMWMLPYQTGFCSNGENVWLNSLSGRTQNQGRSWFLSSNNHKLRFLFTILGIHIFKLFLNWSREFRQAISQYNQRYLISRSWADFFCYCVYQISKIKLFFAKITESLNWNFCPTFWKWSSLPFWNLLTTFHTFWGVFFLGFLRKSKYIEHSFNKYIQNSFIIF